MNAFLEKLKMYDLKTTLSYAMSEIKNRTVTRYLKGSYSQTGEDLVIDGLLGAKENGFYVDVGAGDPIRFNNTRRFYKRGWNGINIEPNLERFRKLCADRERDVNLNIGIGPDDSIKPFFLFIPDTLSTFSAQEAERYKKKGYRLVEASGVELHRLDEVLSEYCGERRIDFMSVDTEGLDLDVLQSNDWTRFKPRVICVESVRHGINWNTVEADTGCESLLVNVGYEKVHDSGLNSIYLLAQEDCPNR